MRWGDVRAENLIYEELYQQIDSSHLFKIQLIHKNNKNQIKNQNKNNYLNYNVTHTKNILIFTPLLVTYKRLNYFSSAVAQNHRFSDVIIIDTKELLISYNKINYDQFYHYLYEIIREYNIECIVAFDFSAGFILKSINYFLFKKMDTSFIKQIFFIRPVFLKQDCSLLKLIPFSYRWIFTIISKFLLRRGSKFSFFENYKEIDLLYKNTIQYSQPKHPDLYYIFSQYPLANYTFFVNLIKESKFDEKLILKFEKGGFRFYNQESLLFAEILKNIQY